MASQITVQVDGGSATSADATIASVIDIDGTTAAVDVTTTSFLLGGM